MTYILIFLFGAAVGSAITEALLEREYDGELWRRFLQIHELQEELAKYESNDNGDVWKITYPPNISEMEFEDDD